MNEKSFAAEAAKSKEIAMEKAKELVPALTALHDFAEDRSVMGNREVADLLAKEFTHPGVEVFSDFADALKEAKARQTEEEKE